MKKFIAIIQLLALIAAAWGITPAAAATEYPFNANFVTIISNKESLGSVYYDNEVQGFTIQMENPTSNEYNVTLTLEVYDANETVWTKTVDGINLPAKATDKRGFSFDVKKYGVYTIKAMITGNFDSIVVNKLFSKVARNEKRDNFISVQGHFSDLYGYEKELPTIHQMENGGIGYIRDGYRWYYTETELSENENEKIYDFPSWREDNINKLIAAGNKIILTLGFLNPLYDNNTMPYSPEGIEAYASFCAATAEHFKGRVDVFEIGNEPDHINFAKRDATGDEYAKLLKAARDAIKNIDENITVIGGSLCSHRDLDNREFLTEFAEEIEANGGWKKYMDAVAYHPYSSDGYYSDEVLDMTFLQNLEFVHSKLGDDIPVWITEYGSSTYQDDEGEWVFTESEQAADLVRTITAAKSEDTIKVVSIYNFRKPWASMTEREHNFGIVYQDYSSKPAYIALSYMNRILKDAEYVGRLANTDYYSEWEQAQGNSNRAFDLYRFCRGKEDIMVLWEHTNASAQLTLNNTSTGMTAITQDSNNVTINCKADNIVEVYDMYGNLMEGTTFDLSDEPIYVISKPGINVIESGDLAVVTGVTKPFTDLTLLARRRGSLAKDIVAIRQTVTDENGNFTFSIRVPEDDAYILYISENGEKQSINMRMPEYEIEAGCSVDGVEISSVSELKNGETVDITLKLTDNKSLGQTLLFSGVLTAKHGALKIGEMRKTEWKDDIAEISFPMNIEDAEDIQSLKLLLWNENFEPVSSPLILK